MFPDHPDIAAVEKVLNEDKAAGKQQASSQSLLTDSDREKINLLKEQFKENPRDKNVKKELQSILQTYESDVKALVEAGDYDTAIEFVKEVQAIAPQSRKLKVMLNRLEKKKQEQAN